MKTINIKKMVAILISISLLMDFLSTNVFADEEGDDRSSQTNAPETSEDSGISNFAIKAYNPLNEELILDVVDSYRGDVIYLKAFDESGKELDLDLFDFKGSSGLFPYRDTNTGTIHKFITSKQGIQTITATLKEDNSKQSSVSFNCVEGNTEIRFVFISCDELWYKTTQVKNNEYYLNYPDAYNSDLIEKNPKTNNVRQWVQIKSYYGKYTSPYLTEVSGWPSISEYDLSTSDSNVVKTYIENDTYNSWMIEITGNGTAEITATLLSNPSIKTSMIITVENYPEKETVKTNQTTKPTDNKQESKTNIVNESSNTKDVSTSNENDVVLIDAPMFGYKEEIIKSWCVIVTLAISIVILVLFLITRNKMFAIIDVACIVLTIVIGAMILIINKPVSNYNKALELYENGNYKEALDLLKDDDDELKQECAYRLLIDKMLNNDIQYTSNIIGGNTQNLISKYKESSSLYDSYTSFYSLIDELSKHTSYRHEKLYSLLNDKFKDYISNEINIKEVGDTFALRDYSFKIIEKQNDAIFVIANDCFIQTSIIDDSWKEDILNSFTNIERNFISEDDLILLTRDDFKKYCSKISISEYSWWLDDISRVTKTDVNGVVHKLRYYAIGNDSASQRNTDMIDDIQDAGSYSYSYIDNDSIWIRPVIRININD